MRGRSRSQRGVFCMIDLETLVPQKHPLREVKKMCLEVLKQMDGEFDEAYASDGRVSIPPERLLMSWVLMALYSVRSCRMFAEQLRYNLLFKWFLDMEPDQEGFHSSTFSQNMERFESGHLSEIFFAEVVELARSKGWVSNEHFSVDGTLIEAWASMKSFRPKDEEDQDGDSNGWSDFKGSKRSNDTHQSRTDPEAKLMRKGKGKEAKLCFGMHSTVENRNGLIVILDVKGACGEGCSEPEVAKNQLDELSFRGFDPRSVGADKGYHTKDFVSDCIEKGTAPHVARISGRKTPGLDGRHARSKAYKTSQRLRKRVEEPFGWMKTTGMFRKSRWRGIAKTHFAAQFVGAACNLVRMAKLAMDDPPGQKLNVA